VTTRRIVLAGVIGVAVVLALWELYVRVFGIERFILIPPSTIVSEIWDNRGFYWEATLVTARHSAIGIAIGLVVAVAVGAVLASSRFLEQAAQPVLIGVLVAPWVAYFASIVLWLGPGDPPVIFLVAFVTTPAFVFATVAGMRSADPAARELLASVDASRLEVLWRLCLPAALPTILAAARYNVGLALAAAYYAEGGNQSTEGLGAAGRRASQNADVLWATILCTAALGAIFLALLSLIERVALRWHVSQRTRARARVT
jgi:ABC-type nitrate/sulfonate/bicarbonate transport system permease component